MLFSTVPKLESPFLRFQIPFFTNSSKWSCTKRFFRILAALKLEQEHGAHGGARGGGGAPPAASISFFALASITLRDRGSLVFFLGETRERNVCSQSWRSIVLSAAVWFLTG